VSSAVFGIFRNVLGNLRDKAPLVDTCNEMITFYQRRSARERLVDTNHSQIKSQRLHSSKMKNPAQDSNEESDIILFPLIIFS
jgi:hypothetical protein